MKPSHESILDALPMLVAYVDCEQTYQYANAHFSEAMNIEPGKLVGQTMRQFLGETAHAELLPAIRSVLQGERQRFERTGWKQNAQTHFLVEYVPDVDASGTVVGFTIMVLDITSRRRAELALEASERRIRTIADNVPVMISHFDKDLRYTFANAEVGRAFGCDPLGLVGQHLREVRGEEVFADISPRMLQALAGESISIDATSNVDGNVQHFEANYVPERNAAGEVTGFFALTFDVTARKDAERKTRFNERLLDRAGRIAGIGGWQYEVVSGELVWTGQTRRIHEVDDDYSPTTETAIAFYAPEARPLIEQAMQRAMMDGASWDLELPFVTAAGRPIWVRTSGEVEMESGTPVRFFGAFQDITERKRAEQMLLDGEHRLRMIADNLPALVSYIDQQERYRFVNAHVKRIFGIDPQSLLGRTMREVRGDRLHANCAPHVACALRGEAVSFQDSAEVHGRLYHYETTFIPDIDGSGVVQGFYAMTFDITSMKQTQGRLDTLARTDALTGLANRRQFEEQLHQAMARSSRTGSPIALMFLDVDHFKRINDSFGHATGDIVLCEFARRLESSIRRTDLVARLAGDEFVVLFDGVEELASVERIAKKIVAAVRLPIPVAESSIVATASIGVVSYDGGLLDAGALLASADKALYVAKSRGRNQFHFPTVEG